MFYFQWFILSVQTNHTCLYPLYLAHGCSDSPSHGLSGIYSRQVAR